MASIKSQYVFSLLSVLGLLAQWGAMVANGTLLALVVTAWEGHFPGGLPMNTTWSGLWPIDYVLGLLVAFFYPLLNVKDLGTLAPILLLTDLLLSLAVFNFMSVVQGGRSRNTGPLRYPAAWQLAWEFFGAATIMPIYLSSYIKTQTSSKVPLPSDQAGVLPFMAAWAVLSNLPLLAPGVIGASPFIIQLSIVIWFFLPLTTKFIQDSISAIFTSSRPGKAKNSIVVGYGIVGLASAVFHVAVRIWTYNSSEMSWTRMYWPEYSAVQPGPNLLLQGATLFCQYGHMSLRISVVALALYTVGLDTVAVEPPPNKARAGRLMALLIAITAVFGPGAGAAWLLYMRETGTETETSKRVA
ncbi:hypothetical protein GQX73_g6386 [Xylaria multiplex]|uniref:Uncharacterized protein n=1 Tax=Xylaria multiplex TaxID=323545 RepID=A0A7C8MWC1_9PEZI|nr:hypothetical protein GQX73_g6386 [Xylaria multiplex]